MVPRLPSAPIPVVVPSPEVHTLRRTRRYDDDLILH